MQENGPCELCKIAIMNINLINIRIVVLQV